VVRFENNKASREQILVLILELFACVELFFSSVGVWWSLCRAGSVQNRSVRGDNIGIVKGQVKPLTLFCEYYSYSM
jgi:hypothetical protein